MPNLNAAMIAQTLSAPRGIYRKPLAAPMLRAANSALRADAQPHENLTLYETPNPSSGVLYDLFDTFAMFHDGAQPRVSCAVKFSFAKPAELKSVNVFLVDKDSHEMLAATELAAQPGQVNSRTIKGSIDAAGIDKNKLNNAVLIAEATWQKQSAEAVSVCKSSSIQPLSLELDYTHTYPKRETAAVNIGNVEPNPGFLKAIQQNTYSKAKKDGVIVIALYRKPADTSDVDYICYFGRPDGDLGKPPYFGVPAMGEINIGQMEFAAFEAKAYVEPCDESGKPIGGVHAVVPQRQHETTTGDIDHSIEGNTIKYDLLGAWDGGKDTFEGEGGFTKHYYKFHLNITIIDKRGKEYLGLIASSISEDEKGMYSFTREVGLIAVMFGCLAQGTLVRTPTGDIPIENLRIGDSVYNPLAKTYSQVTNTWQGVEHEPMLTITTEVGAVTMTNDHPVFTPNGPIQAGKLAVGDSIIAGDGKSVKVIGLGRSENAAVRVYNLDTDADSETQCFVAGNVTVGTNNLQNSI